MVVAPSLNDFPKAGLARLCYFSGWPCFIAGSTFLFLVFNTMHLSSFISHYFTFAYSESHDRLSSTAKLFYWRPISIFYGAAVHYFESYIPLPYRGIEFQLPSCKAGLLLVLWFSGITWIHANSLHKFFCCLNYYPKSCMPMWCNYAYKCPTRETRSLPLSLQGVPCEGLSLVTS